MPLPSTAARQLRRSLALALLAVLTLSGAPVHAAGEVEIEARALVAGRFPAGGWAALSVTLSNAGPPTSGYLVAAGEDGTVRRFVDLPAGARKQVPLYLRPAAFTRQVDVRFEDAEGRVIAGASAPVRVIERRGAVVALVGDGGGNLRSQVLARSEGLPEPIGLLPADLPERPEPLDGLAAIIWAADSTRLGEAERRALERWIASGGELVVVAGPDWQARSAGFADLLPVESITAVDGVDPAPLAAWAGAEPAELTPHTVAVGSLRPGAIGLVPASEDDPRPLLASSSFGAGRVVWIAADFATEPFRAWPGGPALWGRLLPDDRLELRMWGGPPLIDELSSELTGALSQLPALRIPPAELLIGMIVAYILLIGPGSYWVLRRLDRRELAWVTAPILVVLFSASSYGVGSALRGSSVIVHEVDLIRVAAGGAVASVQAYAGIFSPTRATYDLRVEGDALLATLTGIGLEPGPAIGAGYAIEQGDPARLRGLTVGSVNLQPLRADVVTPYTPALAVVWRYSERSVTGTVTNRGEATVEDVAIISGAGGKMIGDLEPGDKRDFTITASDFSGGSAAEQLYGFGFGDLTEEQRVATIRRSAITAIVGYGGYGGRLADFAPGIDRGPFVVGWHPDHAPVTVEVDGEEVQRYQQSVEILSGRPQLGPGRVILTPAQLPTQVVATEGEAFEEAPGWVGLGNGSVTFRVSLPLDAANLEVDGLTVITGNDPGSVWGPNSFISLLPEGYSVQVLDPQSGEWNEVGDPSRRNRFSVEQPARFLAAGGYLELRITGTEIPAHLGHSPVYVGVELAGVVR